LYRENLSKVREKLEGNEKSYFIDGKWMFLSYLMDFEKDVFILKLFDYDQNLILEKSFRNISVF
jgi:hypothetical protein